MRNLSYLLFDSYSSTIQNFSSQEIVSVDTSNIGYPEYIGGSECDVFPNNQIDFGDVKDGRTNHLLSLRIPVEVEYILLEDKFFC